MSKRKRYDVAKDSDTDEHIESSDNQDEANGSSNKKNNNIEETSKDANISISSKKEPFLILKRIKETQYNLITERRAAKSKPRIDVKSNYADDSIDEESENDEDRDAATNIRSKNKLKKTKQSKEKTEITKRRDVKDSDKEESEMDKDRIVSTKMHSKSKIKPNKPPSKKNTGITKRRVEKSINYAEDSNEESENEEDSEFETNMQFKSKLKPNKQPSKKISGITNKKKDVKSINYAIDSNEEESEKNENIAVAKNRQSKNKFEHIKQSSKKSSSLTKHGKEVKSINYANDSSSEESNDSSKIADYDPKCIKDLKCRFCGTIFKTYLSLKSHIHLYHIPYKCPICYDDSTFKERYKYMNHMKIYHPEIGPYPCDYRKCSENFYKEKELRAHKKSHLPFMCKFCKKNYAQKRFMKLHVQKNHLS